MKIYKVWIEIEEYDTEEDEYSESAAEPIDVGKYYRLDDAVAAQLQIVHDVENTPAVSLPSGRVETLDELTDELDIFCEENGYEKKCAAELLIDLQGGEPSHVEYLELFIERWVGAAA